MPNTSHHFYITLLFISIILPNAFGQAKTGHIIYDLISYEIIDSQNYNENKTNYLLTHFVNSNQEVYYNKLWFVVIKNKDVGVSKYMYNRKSRILYKFYDNPNMKVVVIDSILSLYRRDSKLSVARDTLRELLGLFTSKNEVATKYGFRCHKEYWPQSNADTSLDEIWKASFIKVPNLIYPDHFYFLNEGLPIEIVQDFVDVKITWGIKNILPIARHDRIFKLDLSGYSIKTDDINNEMYKIINFITR